MLARMLRFAALVLEGNTGGSPLPPVMVAGALVSVALIAAVMLSAGVGCAVGPLQIARVGSGLEVLARLRQSNPAAAGHSRSRAPGQGD